MDTDTNTNAPTPIRAETSAWVDPQSVGSALGLIFGIALCVFIRVVAPV